MNPVISPALQRKESVDEVHISPELTSDERKQPKELMVEGLTLSLQQTVLSN
jgi:hypothetical protein